MAMSATMKTARVNIASNSDRMSTILPEIRVRMALAGLEKLTSFKLSLVSATLEKPKIGVPEEVENLNMEKNMKEGKTVKPKEEDAPKIDKI